MTKLLTLLFVHAKECHSSMVRILSGAGRRAIQEKSKVSAFFWERSGRVKSVFASGFSRLKFRFYAFVKKMIEALLVNAVFILFAKTVQAVFWINMGIGIYAIALIATQPDGYERVMNFFLHMFGGGAAGW